MTPPQHIQTDYGPRLEEEHADDAGTGINNEIRGVTGLGVGGWGWDYSCLSDINKHGSQQTANEQNKAALRGLEGLAIVTKTMSQIVFHPEN